MTSWERSEIRRKQWTRQEVAALAAVFPGQRYELIEGDLIDKLGQNPPHAFVIAVLTGILARPFPGRLRVQSTITLPDPEGIRSEPEPDLVLLHRESAEFFDRHPGPADIALLIEVADSSLHMDREIKRRLYARCGIQTYRIVDIPQRRLLLFRHPSRDEYKTVQIYEVQDHVTLDEGLLPVAVASLFGPAHP